MIKKRRIYRSKSIFQEDEWYCLNCPVWVWPNHWFNEFPQFEHLIRREGNLSMIKLKSFNTDPLKPQKQ